MTIAVEAEPLAVPPRVVVDVAAPAGSVMQSLAVYRTDSGSRTLLRSQPSAGFDSRTIHDYEAPYGVPLLYSWETVYSDPSLYETVFSEPWASLAAWSGDTDIASVSGGKVTLTPYMGGQSISRSAVGPWGRVTFDSIAGGRAGGMIIDVLFVGDRFVSLGVMSDGKLRVSNRTASITTPINAAQPFTLTQTDSTILLQGTGGTASIAHTPSPIISISISNSTDALPAVVGAITVENSGAPASLSEIAAPVTLNSADAWLVHPASPVLSVSLSNTDPWRAGIRTIEPVTRRSTATTHEILGSSAPVVTTSGPRQSDTTGMVIYTATTDERRALDGLLEDQTPILIQVPPSWDLGFARGFYAVGDVVTQRFLTKAGLPQRDHRLPLTRVESPAVLVQNPGWSWAALAAEFPSWASVAEAFASWADLASNIRKPGF